jgi:stage II sporulation protein D
VRATFVVLAIAAAVAATASAQSPLPSGGYGEALFLVSGRGYGHGVGMSQYGAYGQAKAGRTYDKILAHYYTGTELERATKQRVRVLLAEGRGAVVVGSEAKISVRDASGTQAKLAPGSVTLRPDLRLPSTDATSAASQPELTPPLVLQPTKASAPLTLDGRPYRGRLELRVDGGYLRVVNVVAVEAYVQGVVAGEMPDSWPAEALKAQAVAARSYALSHLLKGKPFDLYSDVRSQLYSGLAGEKPSTNQAVKATARQVLRYDGEIASTLYFSSSGGKTASAADVFGTDVPYLVSRPDPWDKASPYFRWGPVLIGARTLQSKLGESTRVIDAKPKATPSGRLRALVLTTTAGAESVPPSLVRSALGLRSTWISIGVLRLDRPASGSVVFGSKVRLTGVARGIDLATLASSLDGTRWSVSSALVPDGVGGISFDAKPTRTTRYRIEAGGAASPAQLVQVSPRIRLAQGAEPGVLVGTVRPKLAGTRVDIERKAGYTWVAAGSAVLDGSGSFRAELASLGPGSYRATIASANGFAEARSPVLQVTG